MLELFGRFHPVVVHLPIGILLLVFVFEWLVTRARWEHLEPAIATMLWIGTAAAGLACGTGFLLRQAGNYGGHIDSHQWMGLALFFFCLAYAYFRWLIHQSDYRKWIATAMVVVLTVTGHLGGTLTHGTDYLFATTSPDANVNMQEAMYYADVIGPLLEKRCVACHGASKQKGGLRLDGRAWIEKGGEHGPVLVAGDASGSKLLQRVLLPLAHEDHMPPQEKPQLTPTEIAWLEDWINTGASFEKRVVEVTNPEKFETKKPGPRSLPDEAVDPAPEKDIARLQGLGATVLPVSTESNYLSVALTNATPSDTLMDALAPLRFHIVWLKADCRGWTPQQLKTIAQFPKLTKWWLNQSGIKDDCLLAMEPSPTLNYLNLTGTAVTNAGVETLLRKNALTEIYLFQTAVTGAEIAALQKKFPATRIEGAGYRVPTLPSDTTEVK